MKYSLTESNCLIMRCEQSIKSAQLTAHVSLSELNTAAHYYLLLKGVRARSPCHGSWKSCARKSLWNAIMRDKQKSFWFTTFLFPPNATLYTPAFAFFGYKTHRDFAQMRGLMRVFCLPSAKTQRAHTVMCVRTSLGSKVRRSLAGKTIIMRESESGGANALLIDSDQPAVFQPTNFSHYAPHSRETRRANNWWTHPFRVICIRYNAKWLRKRPHTAYKNNFQISQRSLMAFLIQCSQ